MDGGEPLRRDADRPLRRVLLAAGIAYVLLQSAIIADQGPTSKLAAAVGKDVKGKLSPILLALAILVAFVREWLTDAIYVIVVLMWLLPDRRIESRVSG
jgi:TMEM175 potassium channel family protein